MTRKPFFPPIKPPRDGMGAPPYNAPHPFGAGPPARPFGAGPPARPYGRGHPPPPPPGHGGSFAFLPPFGPPPGAGPFDAPPPLPLTREDFMEMKHIFVLLIIQGHPDGITGYRLQERYSFPRGTLLRILAELEENEFVETKELVEGGRKQKVFSLNDKGIEYLEGLKEKWALQFAMLSDVAPPERYAFPFHEPRRGGNMLDIIDNLESKQEADDFFRGMRGRVTGLRNRLSNRLDDVNGMLDGINGIIDAIGGMETLDKPLLKQLFLETRDLAEKPPRDD
ncbi:MAG: PadR family transcriptional regulator [Promethearchaeota archaeon]